MAKNVKARDFDRAMLAAGARVRTGKGSHVFWYCPCGDHMITVTNGHGTVAPNAIRDVATKMPCITVKF